MVRCMRILCFFAAAVFLFYQNTAHSERLAKQANLGRTVLSKKHHNNIVRATLHGAHKEHQAQNAFNLPDLHALAISPAISRSILTVTAYTSKKHNKHHKKKVLTASSTSPEEGAVAVSRDLFKKGWKFGKRIYIRHHGIFTITDLMHSRKVKWIDIYMDKKVQAIQFGKKQLEVLLLDV